MKILITGGNGNISKIIVKNLSCEYDITSITRNDFDLLNELSVSNYLMDKEFDILIHTAIKGGRRTKEEISRSLFHGIVLFCTCIANILGYSDGVELRSRPRRMVLVGTKYYLQNT